MQIVTANGTFSYTGDWNRIERSRRPTLAAANVLHHARQRTDTPRWWFMRWPSDAVSLVGRSLSLGTGKTYKLMRQLREHSTTHLTKPWQLTVDMTGERYNTEARLRLRLQVDWAETKRRLGTHGRNAKRQLMPGWVVVAKFPLQKLKHQLAAWKRVRATSRNKQETDGSQHSTAPPGAQNALCGFVFRKVRRILLRLRQKKISPIEAKERKLWPFAAGQSISSLESRQAWTRPEPQSLDFAVSCADFNGSAQLQ